MEKKNYLSEILAKGFTPEQNALAISLMLAVDNDLYEFYVKQAVLVIYLTKGIKDPSTEQIAEQMVKCVNKSARVLKHAVEAYDDYLTRGNKSIVEGMAFAYMMMQVGEQVLKDQIFKEHFGDIFKKAE
jgi:hypothetical protein